MEMSYITIGKLVKVITLAQLFMCSFLFLLVLFTITHKWKRELKICVMFIGGTKTVYLKYICFFFVHLCFY